MEIVVVKECANGNASVGTEWLETKVFEESSTIKEVLDWANPIRPFEKKRSNYQGRIMITVASTGDGI